jgi:hypothetical protein
VKQGDSISLPFAGLAVQLNGKVPPSTSAAASKAPSFPQADPCKGRVKLLADMRPVRLDGAHWGGSIAAVAEILYLKGHVIERIGHPFLSHEGLVPHLSCSPLVKPQKSAIGDELG